MTSKSSIPEIVHRETIMQPSRRNVLKRAVLIACVGLPLLASPMISAAEAAEPLRLAGRTELPRYSGDFDHFAVDVAGARLFLAAEDGGTLEVFDLKTGKHLKSIEGFEAPHAIHFIPQTNRLIVTDSGEGMSKIVDGKSYRIVDSIKLTPGADVMAYDRSRNHLWIVTGGKNAKEKLPHTIVYEVNASTGKPLGSMQFDTDFTEAIAFEQNGPRMFVNLSGKSEVAVLDKSTRKVLATWPIKAGENNAPIALDERNKRLFVVTRKPFKLVVLNSDTGEAITSLEAPKRTNELVFDKTNKRLYMAGDDYIGVVAQNDADHYEEIARVPSATGAKTAILVPELKRLYVAVSPGEGPTGGALLRYDVLP
jgi:DNA-binding beta-propeller fold protein YncE